MSYKIRNVNHSKVLLPTNKFLQSNKLIVQDARHIIADENPFSPTVANSKINGSGINEKKSLLNNTDFINMLTNLKIKDENDNENSSSFLRKRRRNISFTL